jgi:hypothetical protein
MISRRLGIACVLAAFVIGANGFVSHAAAEGCQGHGAAGADSVSVSVSCTDPGGSGTTVSSADGGGPSYVRYEWHSPCTTFQPGDPVAEYVDCGIARTCTDPAYRLWQLWGFAAEDQQWHYITSQCLGASPTAAQTPRPQVTPGLVLDAIRRIGLPRLSVHIQPQGKTLVNFDTNFYVDPQRFSRTITLLGQSVDVEATPAGYTWRHGDGTSATTTEPGAPYPDLAVTYAYQQAATVAPSVQVTYTARFRVGGGAWQQIPGTVTVDGPPTTLAVVEGTGVLSGDH